MRDDRLRDLERQTDRGDPQAVDRLVLELERTGALEHLLVRTQALLIAAWTDDRGERLARGELALGDVVDAVRALIAAGRGSRLLFDRSLPDHGSPRPFAFAGVVLDESGVRVVAGRSEPDALAAHDAAGDVPGGDRLVMSRAVATAWTRWCEGDLRTWSPGDSSTAPRRRPAMYVGDAGARGLHELIEACLEDVVAERLAGAATEATVTLHPDGSIEVADDGRGVPGRSAGPGPPPLLQAYLLADPRGSRIGRGERSRSSLWGAGMRCVNVLSEWFEVETADGGEAWRLRFEHGQPALRSVVGTTRRARGTRVRFAPDRTIFLAVRPDASRIERRLEELACLLPGLRLTLVDAPEGRTVVHQAEGGLGELIDRLCGDAERLLPRVLRATGEVQTPGSGAVHVDAALTWTRAAPGERVRSFVNLRGTTSGAHADGLLAGIVAALEGHALAANLDAAEAVAAAAAVCDQLVAAVAVRLEEPAFLDSWRERLANDDVAAAVRGVVTPAVDEALRAHPALFEALARRP